MYLGLAKRTAQTVGIRHGANRRSREPTEQLLCPSLGRIPGLVKIASLLGQPRETAHCGKVTRVGGPLVQESGLVKIASLLGQPRETAHCGKVTRVGGPLVQESGLVKIASLLGQPRETP